jgi:DNA-directed RNA polymerase subunit E'/Rpb7
MYKSCFIEEQAILTPREFDTAAVDLDGFLTFQLRKKLEGRCSPQGFIKEGSLKLLSRTLGQSKSGSFTGDFIFRCKIECDVLYPAADDVVIVEVLKANKMGAYATFENSLRVLLPRDLHLGNADFDQLEIGDKIKTTILKTRFKFNDEYISAIGQLVEIVERGSGSGSGSSEAIDLAPAPAPVSAEVANPSSVLAPVPVAEEAPVSEGAPVPPNRNVNRRPALVNRNANLGLGAPVLEI